MVRSSHVPGEEIKEWVVELEKAIMSLKIGKPGVPEGIYAEILKDGTNKFYDNLTCIINHCHNCHSVAESGRCHIFLQFIKNEIKKFITTQEEFQ